MSNDETFDPDILTPATLTELAEMAWPGPAETAQNAGQDVLCDPKETEDHLTPCSVLETSPGDDQDGVALSLYGRGPLNFSAPSEPETGPRTRRSRHDIPWHEKREIAGYKVTRSLSKVDRDAIETAATAAPLLGHDLIISLCFKPPTDHLSPVERLKLWSWYEQKIRSHCSARQKATGRPFPCAFVMVRESDPETNLGEHTHWLVACPRCEREVETFKRVASGWGVNAYAADADQEENVVDGKVKSAVAYMTKASPQAVFADDTVLYRLSGAVVGPRFKITRNIGPKAQAKVADELQLKIKARTRIRSEKARVARRKRWMRIQELAAVARRRDLATEHLDAQADAAAGITYLPA